MPSKRRPTTDPEVLRTRIIHAARTRLRLEVKEAADKAGTSHWNWYKKESGEAFTLEQCVRFAENVGAPTLFPFYDWDHAEELDEKLGWA